MKTLSLLLALAMCMSSVGCDWNWPWASAQAEEKSDAPEIKTVVVVDQEGNVKIVSRESFAGATRSGDRFAMSIFANLGYSATPRKVAEPAVLVSSQAPAACVADLKDRIAVSFGELGYEDVRGVSWVTKDEQDQLLRVIDEERFREDLAKEVEELKRNGSKDDPPKDAPPIDELLKEREKLRTAEKKSD